MAKNIFFLSTSFIVFNFLKNEEKNIETPFTEVPNKSPYLQRNIKHWLN